MKKITLFFAIILFATFFSQGQPVEIKYDNGTHTGFQSLIPERIFSVHFSPTAPCEVVAVKYFVQKTGFSEGFFLAFLYAWEGSEPATTAIYEGGPHAIVLTEWKEVNINGSINFDGDFVVGFKHLDQSAYLGIDVNMNTGRNWVFDITNTDWSEVTDETYLIRALVEYSTGEREELIGHSLNIYPNPATDVINIEAAMKVDRVNIMNTVGQVVYSKIVDHESVKIDLSNFESGLYLMQIEANGERITRKIIVE